MVSQTIERLLPHRADQLFDLAADVERYPEYLPLWKAARIRRREANVYYTDQRLGLGPISVSFGSTTILQRPNRIDVTSSEVPFRQFRLSWLFGARPGGCLVRVVTEFQLRNPLLQLICEQLLPSTVGEIIAAFEKRAASLYQPPDQST